MNFGSVITLRKKTPGATSVMAVSVGLNQPEAMPAATTKRTTVEPATRTRLRLYMGCPFLGEWLTAIELARGSGVKSVRGTVRRRRQGGSYKCRTIGQR